VSSETPVAPPAGPAVAARATAPAGSAAPATPAAPAKPAAPAAGARATERDARPPVRMLHDRVLVRLDQESAERRSASGIVIPATASMAKRLAWGVVVAAGQHVRQVDVGDRVLFDPEDRAEVELGGVQYLLLRERDIHGVAEPEDAGRGTGLYL